MTVTIRTSIFSREIITNLIKYKKAHVRNKSFNSHEWLKRRQMDPYIELTKQKNYRCRSAFKLIEIDDKYKLLKPGFKVLDIGAAPGSWSQVLAERTNSNGKDADSPVGLVIALDLSTISEIEGVVILPSTDFRNQTSQDKICKILGEGEKFDFIFSDMAPAATVNNLKVGGGCLVKIWDGGQAKDFRSDISRFFKFVNTVKPSASYKSSAESFILAREFMGLKT